MEIILVNFVQICNEFSHQLKIVFPSQQDFFASFFQLSFHDHISAWSRLTVVQVRLKAFFGLALCTILVSGVNYLWVCNNLGSLILDLRGDRLGSTWRIFQYSGSVLIQPSSLDRTSCKTVFIFYIYVYWWCFYPV